MSEDIGDFEEIAEGDEKPQQTQDDAPARVRLPRSNERIGIIAQRLGGNRMEVQCTDGKTRNCRVPGRYKRTLWLRPKDIVLVQPWENDDNKADVVFKYVPGAIHQLRKRGLLNTLSTSF